MWETQKLLVKKPDFFPEILHYRLQNKRKNFIKGVGLELIWWLNRKLENETDMEMMFQRESVDMQAEIVFYKGLCKPKLNDMSVSYYYANI